MCYWRSFLAHRVVCEKREDLNTIIRIISTTVKFGRDVPWITKENKFIKPLRNRKGFLILQTVVAVHLPPVWMWITKMFSPRKNSLPSPSLEDSFFPLSSSSSVSLSFALPSSTSSPSSSDSGGGIETDLILAAELGQALLEKNEELAASLEQSERQVEVWIKPLYTGLIATMPTFRSYT